MSTCLLMCQFCISYARSLFPALAFPLSLPTVIDTLHAPPPVSPKKIRALGAEFSASAHVSKGPPLESSCLLGCAPAP